MLQIPKKNPLGRVFMKFVCFGIELNRKNKKNNKKYLFQKFTFKK